METIIGKEFPQKVIPLIEQAKNSIFIIVYDWRWYPDQIGSSIQKFNNAIITSSKKGRKVKVITDRQHVNEVFEKIDIQVKKINSKKTIHTKLMIIDGKTAILGSHNYTMKAFDVNHEISIILQDEQVIKRLKLYFENLWWL